MDCRQRTVRRTTLEHYSISVDHDGRSYDLVVDDLEVLQCENCGTMVLEDSANKRISDALRREVGLLLPDEILANRNRLGLTQKQLAAYLRIAESTLCRWETGGQIQQRAMDGLLRVFFQSAEARAILGLPQFETSPGLAPSMRTLEPS
jgi:DNA-binding transcriptional regulator YiaG